MANETGSPQSLSLINSPNLAIAGGQFNQVQGHHTQIHGRNHTNVVINVNPQGSPSGSLPSNETNHVNLTLSPGQSTQLNYDTNQSQVSPQVTLQKSNDIYERHLTLKGRGFPLWIPEPNQVLHIDYRRTGIRIGDVGIITHSGGFSFLFNICLPHDDPVNPQMLPEHFSPITPPIEATDIEKFLVFKNGSHLASASIEGSQTSTAISGTVFESSASDGAILTMPRGAMSEDLTNFARFRKYAAANVAEWYKFVNGPRGREAKNGDVRLVVGFDKTTSWGIATFANQAQQNHCRLRFGPSEGVGLTASANTYSWEYSGAAEVRAGPDAEENDGLRRDGDPADMEFENQCLFVRTLNVTLTDEVWTSIHSGFDSVPVNSQNSSQVQDHSESNDPHSSNSGTGSGSGILPSQATQSGTQSAVDSVYGSQVVQVVSDDNPGMFISGPFQSLTAHPSKVLNDFLLTKVPSAKMVITHDGDWSSVVNQRDTWPAPREVIERILALRNVCEENGVIFLQPKEISNEVSKGSASGNRVQVSEALMASSAEPEMPFDHEYNNINNDIENSRKITWLGRLVEDKVAYAKKLKEMALKKSSLAKNREVDTQIYFNYPRSFLYRTEIGTDTDVDIKDREEWETPAHLKEKEAEAKRFTEEFKQARSREIEANAKMLEYQEREAEARTAASSLPISGVASFLELLFTGTPGTSKTINDDIKQYHEMAEEAHADMERARMAADDAQKRLAQIQAYLEATQMFRSRIPGGIRPEFWPSEEEFQLAKDRIQYHPEKIHLAVCGSSGSGKSSLVNAFRGLKNKDPDAAPTAVVETTRDITRYPDPRKELPYSRLVWFDCPSPGTPMIPPLQYFNQQGLFIFDAIILVYDQNLTATDECIIQNCERFKIPLFIVLSKADIYIWNIMQDLGCAEDDTEDKHDEFQAGTRQSLIDKTRKNVETKLQEAGLGMHDVFLVSSSVIYALVANKSGKKTQEIDEVHLLDSIMKAAAKRRYGARVAKNRST